MKSASVNIIEKQVVQFRQRCGLGGTEPIRLKSLLLKLDVLTVYHPLSDNFSGMSLRDDFGHCFMLVNSNQPIGRQHFTIAHELYHLFVEENPQPHKCESNGRKSQEEQCADMFASFLLMSAEGVIQMIPCKELEVCTLSVATLLRLEQYFAVSKAALLNRLGDWGLISAVQKEKFRQMSPMQTAKKYGYDTSLYKSGNENLVIGNLGELANKLFDAGLISEGHYIEVLNKLNYGKED